MHQNRKSFIYLLTLHFLMVFGEQLTVMQVRPNYSTVYPFKPSLKLTGNVLNTKKEFVDYIKDLTVNWKEGDYFLRDSDGTFAYFTLKGRSVKLLKKSKKGKSYLCWSHFKE